MTGSNHAYLGETLLQRACMEGDENNKNQLQAKGITELMRNPEKVNLDEVIPLLMKQGIATGVLHLCLRKAESIKDIKQREEIFAIVEAWFWAL